MSTAFHPQTDRETERINQVIEDYLQIYSNYEQNDWGEILAMAEFAYSNSNHSPTKISPFDPKYGYQPQTNWPTEIQFQNPVSELYGHYMMAVQERLGKQLETVREAMAKCYNKQRMTMERVKKGELVMLHGKNIRSKGRFCKLVDKMYGPFKMWSIWHNDRYYKSDLPTSWTIHQTFKVALFEQYRGKNPETEVIEIEADNAGWKIEKKIASGPWNEDATKHVHLVKWEGYSHKKNTCEIFENVNEKARELLEEYYGENANMEKETRFGKEKTRQKNALSVARKKTRKRRTA